VTKEVQISIRLEPALVERFDRLVGKLGGVATRAALARSAMEAGLDVIEQRYENLPDEPSAGSGSKRRKR
jgi:predicted DNA-binding protein